MIFLANTVKSCKSKKCVVQIPSILYVTVHTPRMLVTFHIAKYSDENGCRDKFWPKSDLQYTFVQEIEFLYICKGACHCDVIENHWRCWYFIWYTFRGHSKLNIGTKINIIWIYFEIIGVTLPPSLIVVLQKVTPLDDG